MAFKMKGNPLKMGSMATKSTMKMAKESAMKMKKESPAKKYASDAQRKAVHASKAESGMKMKKESPAKMGHKSPAKMKERVGKKEVSGTEQFDEAMRAAEEKATGKNPDDKSRKMANRKSPAKMKGKPDKKAMEAAGKAVAEGAMTAVAAGKFDKELRAMTKTVKPANKPNFGTGSAGQKKSAIKLSEADKKKAMDNAMPAAEKVSMSKATMAGAKKYGFMDGGSFNQDKAKGELRRLSKMTGQSDSNRAKQAEIRKLMKAFS